MQDFCLQGVWPDKICQANQPLALQDYSILYIWIDRCTAGALFFIKSDKKFPKLSGL